MNAVATKTREQTAKDELAKLVPRAQELGKQLQALRGDGGYVVYTGKADCPVFVKFTDDRTSVLPNIGTLTATRLTVQEAARLAPRVQNGNSERGHFCSVRKALEMELAMIDRVAEMLTDVSKGLPL